VRQSGVMFGHYTWVRSTGKRKGGVYKEVILTVGGLAKTSFVRGGGWGPSVD